MQSNTGRVVVTLVPSRRLILWLQQTERQGKREPRGCAGPNLSERHQYQLATQVTTLAQGVRRGCL